MDPLSVMASVVGLSMAAGQVFCIICKVRSGVKYAPQSMDHTMSDIKAIEVSLLAIHKLLQGLGSTSRHRIAMIQVDQLLATLTEAVLTFSELEGLVNPLSMGPEASLAERIKWYWKEDEVSNILTRLGRYKSSLSLMLNIVQCESDLEAVESRDVLRSLTTKLLRSNLDISRRLHNLEAVYDSASILTTCDRNGNTLGGAEDLEESTNIFQGTIDSRESSQFSNDFQVTTFQYSFEIDLSTSRVYQRTEPYESDVSFTSSNIRTHAWSVFSGLSLSDISMVSALALPLYAHEIPNNQWYSFGEIGLAVSTSQTQHQATSTWPTQDALSTKTTPADLFHALPKKHFPEGPRLPRELYGPGRVFYHGGMNYIVSRPIYLSIYLRRMYLRSLCQE